MRDALKYIEIWAKTGVNFDSLLPSCQIIKYKSSVHKASLEKDHVSYNRRLLINLLKELQMFLLYRGFFRPFQSQLLEHAEWIFFCENRTEIMIRHFLSFCLFSCKWDAHKFSKARVRYSLVDSWFYHYDFLFQRQD